LISIITPVLNGEKFIKKNIESIQALTLPYEHIIVDGGSSDNTLYIIQKYPHLKLIHQSDKTGMYGAIDLGFKNANGSYICWINCDDYIIPESYTDFVLWVEKRDLDFASSNGFLYYLKENKKVLVRSTMFVKYFIRMGFFPFSQPSVLYKKDLYKKVGGLDFNHHKISGDIDLFYRMANYNGVKFGYKNISTSVFLKYGESLGDKNSELGKNEIKQKGLIPPMSTSHKILLRVLRFFHL
jgi:glycosyltransferase involved in cell wall biosynthesis